MDAADTLTDAARPPYALRVEYPSRRVDHVALPWRVQDTSKAKVLAKVKADEALSTALDGATFTVISASALQTEVEGRRKRLEDAIIRPEQVKRKKGD